MPGIYIVVSAVKVIGIIALVREFEIYGIVVASVCSALLEIWMLRYIIREKFDFKFNFYKILGPPILLFAIIVVLEPLYGSTYPYILHSFYLVACAIILFWIYRNDIKLVDPTKIIGK